MAFRVVSIEHPAESHAHAGQLIVAMDEETATIPIEDILMLIADAPNVRLSTMCLSKRGASRDVCDDGEEPLALLADDPHGVQRSPGKGGDCPSGPGEGPGGPVVVARRRAEDAEPGGRARSLGRRGRHGSAVICEPGGGWKPTNREGAAAHCCRQPLHEGTAQGHPDHGFHLRVLHDGEAVREGYVPRRGRGAQEDLVGVRSMVDL